MLLEPGAPRNDARAGDVPGRDERALVPVDDEGAGVVIRGDDTSHEQDGASYEPVELKSKPSRSGKKQ